MLKEQANRIKSQERFCLDEVWCDIPVKGSQKITINFKALFLRACSNLFRNLFSSVLCIISILVVIFMFSCFLVTSKNIEYKIGNIVESKNISLYLKDDLSQNEIDELIEEVSKRDDVVKVDFWSKDKALAKFNTGKNNDLGYISKFSNPLPASLEVNLKTNITDDSIPNIFMKYQGVTDVGYQGEYYSQINKIFEYFKKYSFVLILFISLVTISVILLTIRLTLYNRKDEITILKLIGATDTYIKLPFIIEGALLGLISGLLNLALILFIEKSAIPAFNKTDAGYFLFSNFQNLSIFQLTILTLVGVLMGVIGTFLAVNKNIPD